MAEVTSENLGGQFRTPGRFRAELACFLTRFRPAEIRIRYRPGSDFRLFGPIAKVKHGTIRDFFARELAHVGPIEVGASGRNERTGGRRVWIAGMVSKADSQRIRNFLLTSLD